MQLNLILLKGTYAIYRFKNDSVIPHQLKDSNFYSLTKTKDEISVVSKQLRLTKNDPEINKDWKIFKISGLLDFSLIGIIAEISRILKESNISIFTISTYDTDYIIVKRADLNKAIASLKANGHTVMNEK